MPAEVGRGRAWLTAYRWVAFAGPRTTTGVGVVLLLAITVPQLALLDGRYPGWVHGWSVLAVAVGLLAVAAMLRARAVTSAATMTDKATADIATHTAAAHTYVA